MFKAIYQSLRKSRRLKKVSKELSRPFDVNYFLNNLATNDDYLLDELISIAKSDKNVQFIIDTYNADDATLKGLYYRLVSSGAGQYVSGHYVAASSLVYVFPLIFLLDHNKNGIFEIHGHGPLDSTLGIACRLIEYFEKGEVGEITTE